MLRFNSIAAPFAPIKETSVLNRDNRLDSHQKPNIRQPIDASRTTVYNLFRMRATHRPDALAIEGEARSLTYGELFDEVNRLAITLWNLGIRRGERVAIVSENRPEYLILQLAAARLGAIVACPNWRLALPELQYCLSHVTPKAVFVSQPFAKSVASLDLAGAPIFDIEAWNTVLAPPGTPDSGIVSDVDPEDPLLLLYTSGTTGRPKGALISHRAEIARMAVARMDLGIVHGDAHVAWAPMFHIGGTDQSLAAFMCGSPVIVPSGFDPKTMVDIIERHQIGWLILVPGMIEQLAEEVERRGAKVKGLKAIGCMIDLVPPVLVARITALLNAPFLNSFGLTETGLSPLSGGLIPIGEVPTDTSKRLNSMCEFRLIDAEGNDVPKGETGEGAIRGPMVFSGYWNAPETNREDFATGFFRLGDLFRQCPNGNYEFVDRAKYMIKSGGENIYPAEIERVIMTDPRVADVIVVRKKDAKWGEVPVAFVARKSEDLSEADVEAICRRELAGYKRPKEVHFVAYDDLPRSTSGKILRQEMEKRL